MTDDLKVWEIKIEEAIEAIEKGPRNIWGDGGQEVTNLLDRLAEYAIYREDIEVRQRFEELTKINPDFGK